MAQQLLRSVGYMLLDHVDGQTEGKQGFIAKSRPEIVNFLQGELVIREPPQKQPSLPNWIAVQSFSHRGRYAVVPKGILAPLTEAQLHLLSAVPFDSDRYAAYQNKHLNEAENYSIHSKVIVTVPDFPERTPGIVWYAGPVETLGNGTMFGVELLAEPPRGNCDGTFQGSKYFTCPPNCGIFLPFDKLRLCASDEEFAQRVAALCTKSDKPTKRLRSLTQNEQLPQGRMTRSQTKSDKKSDATESRLQIGMPVVVFQDGGGQFKGDVRWLGDVYRQQTHKVKGQPLTTLMAVAGIEMNSKRKFVEGLEGMESQKQTYFDAQHGGQKVYLPVNTVMPLEEYTGSIHNAPHAGQNGKEAGTQPVTGGSKGAQGEPKEKQGIGDIPRHLLGGLDTVEVMKQQRDIMHRAAQHSHQEPATRLAQMDRHEDNDSIHRPGDLMYEKELKPRDEASVNRHQAMVLKKVQDSYPQHEATVGRSAVLTETDSRYSQYANAGVGSPKNSRRDEPSHLNVNDQHLSMASHRNEFVNEALEIGSVVQVKATPPLYGVLKWIGWVETPPARGQVKVAGVELDERIEGGTDGTYRGERHFKCRDGCGWFVPVQHCVPDTRFQDHQPGGQSTSMTASMRDRASQAKGEQGGFGPVLAEEVSGTVRYPADVTDAVCGEFKGIQGHYNSCYLDATLFSMFYATHVFDTMFNRRKAPGQDQRVYEDLRDILKSKIVNPLRKYHFVRADQVMKLRAKLDKVGDLDGLTHEEKDPEEFLNTLLHQVFKEDPYLELRSGENVQKSYMYQLFMEKDEKMVLPTVQRLVEQSFVGGDLKLQKAPQVFILQMPRFGKQFKLYDRILPSPKLRINDITMFSKRQCVVCEQDAAYECKECSFNHVIDSPVFCASMCVTCCSQIHKHHKRRTHRYRKIEHPTKADLHCGEELELFAVVCIETSHYVSFVKFEDNQWVFFDSMADREGGEDGYNIPCVTHLPTLPQWLNDPDRVCQANLRDIPNPIRRMFVDAYMCMYISPTESMY